ncbi:MAG: hypothetical protein Q9201_001209 [Fulgogasparrea decipioides]
MHADDLSTIEDDTRTPHELPNKSSLSEGANIAEDLVRRCRELLTELESFQEYLAEQKPEHEVELKPFRNTVTAELKSLEKLRLADPGSERTIHTLRSSNLPFYTAVWDAAKTTSGLITFTKRFYWDSPPTRSSKRTQVRKPRCALVDVVAQNGQQWIKVSTVTETRLLFELAKAGWEDADSDPDSDDDGGLVDGLVHTRIHDCDLADGADSTQGSKHDDCVEIVRQAQDLQIAALAHKVHYKHPSVTFILPKISPNPPVEIVRILDTIRSTGAIVRLGPWPPPSDLQSTFQSVVLDPFTNLTSTLNIDCTILLALVSDLSHNATNPEPWFHKAISRQIELEKREQLLPSTLWPAMAGKGLVCTDEAARRMREIVDTIGTESEKKRTDLLLFDPRAQLHDQSSEEELRSTFQELSTYPIPSNWQIPIKVVSFDRDDISHLPDIAKQVKSSLSLINQSVFLYGWVTGQTTLSSNRTVTRQIEEIVEGAEGEVVGPKVWLCGTARSLVGKEKGRRDLKGVEREERSSEME